MQNTINSFKNFIKRNTRIIGNNCEINVFVVLKMIFRMSIYIMYQ